MRIPDLSKQRLVPSQARALQLSPYLSPTGQSIPQAGSCPTLHAARMKA